MTTKRRILHWAYAVNITGGVILLWGWAWSAIADHMEASANSRTEAVGCAFALMLTVSVIVLVFYGIANGIRKRLDERYEEKHRQPGGAIR